MKVIRGPRNTGPSRSSAVLRAAPSSRCSWKEFSRCLQSPAQRDLYPRYLTPRECLPQVIDGGKVHRGMAATGNLDKSLGLTHVFCIATGAMISSGLFLLLGLAHAKAGPGVIASYLLAGVLAMTGALSVAEITTAMPRAGGDYYFVTRAFGSRVGSVAGTLSWFSLSLKSAFAIVGMTTFLRLIVGIHGWSAGAILTLIFVGLNILGVRQAARAQIAMVVGLLGLLLLYVVVGFPRIQTGLLIPFAPYGVSSIFATSAFVFVAYGGLLKIGSIAEEVRNPGRVLPLGLGLSTICVAVVYALTAAVTSGVVESQVLDGSLTPISDGGRVLMGEVGFVAMSIGAILAFISTANAGIMAASRYLLALSRDGQLPPALSRVGPRFRTPHVAILVTGALIVGSLLLRLEILVEAASCVLILTYILACLAVVVLRESRLQNYRPVYRAPLYPWLQIAGISGFCFILISLGVEAYIISGSLIVLAALGFWVLNRGEKKRESAFLHLIARATDRRLGTGELEDELKQIIRERDEIVTDRFDQMIENASFLDIEGSVGVDRLFARVANSLAGKLDMKADVLKDALLARETECASALTCDIAVSDLVIDGEGRFEILVARCRKGVWFSSRAPRVKAVFILVGTRDERSFHLRALASIGQIVRDAQFAERWQKAPSEQALRDLILLGDRVR